MGPEVQERKSVQPAELHSVALERHYSVPEIAGALGHERKVSSPTLRRREWRSRMGHS